MSMHRRLPASFVAFLLLAALSFAQKPAEGERRPPAPSAKDWAAPGEKWLTNVRQITIQGQKSGEAYFSPDQKWISFQSVRGDCPHYQIFVEALDGTALWRASTGKGLTTCSFWRNDGKKLIWASTHLDPDTYGPPPAEGGAYAWNKHPSFDIYESNPDGSERKRLTDAKGYDAEGAYSPDGSRIVFTSERDGDLEIYTMAADGTDVRRVTHAKGYDGGPFFSPDGKRICFRGFRDPKHERYANLFVIDVDGKNERQLTSDLAVNWAPYWHADNDTLVFSKNFEGHSNYDLCLIKVSTGEVGRLTRDPKADVLPVFSPDGKKLMWTSTRADGRSQLFIADFRMPTAEEWKVLVAEEKSRLARLSDAPAAAPASGHGAGMSVQAPALDSAELLATVKELADDKYEGRRAGTEAAAKAATWIEGRFKLAGLDPAGVGGGFTHAFPMLVGLEAEKGAGLEVIFRGASEERRTYEIAPTGFSGSKDGARRAEGPLAFRGYGLSLAGVSDDYAGLSDVKGKIVVLFLRGVPEDVLNQTANPHVDPQAQHGSYAKALEAKKRGAAGVLFVADSKQRNADGLEPPAFDGTGARVGIPCAQIRRSDLAALLGQKLEKLEIASTAERGAGFDVEATAALDAPLKEIRSDGINVLGMVTGTKFPDEVVMISAHYDHLGYGGSGSLAEGGKAEIHNGADDNASGTAGLIALAEAFAKKPGKRTLVFAAWSGEEEGLLGSHAWIAKPSFDAKKLVAVVNLDMIGRYRNEEGVAIDGVATAAEFEALVRAVNTDGLKIATTAGAMSGRSDHAAFIAAGIPALHLFTGAHVDYHRPSDDWERINADGMAKVASYAGAIARAIADDEARFAFVKPKAEEKQVGGMGYGAWFGAIPSYSEDAGGVRLSGVSAGSPAEKAGFKAGDVLVKLGDVDIDNIQDFTTALRSKKPGDEVEVAVLRGGERVVKKLVLGRR
jgi:Tol biopolymer transport system component